jgi:hypothetical protein
MYVIPVQTGIQERILKILYVFKKGKAHKNKNLSLLCIILSNDKYAFSN